MVTVYGADSCEDTQRALRHLRRLGVRYSYQDVDRDPMALGKAIALNDGERRTPTIDVDGTTLVEPTTLRLTGALEERLLISREAADRVMRMKNVGDLERGLRVGGGLLALGLAIRMKSAWRWPLAAWGAMETVTGAVGSCPVYRTFGVTSVAGPGDHPREAERRSWVAPLRARAHQPVNVPEIGL